MLHILEQVCVCVCVCVCEARRARVTRNLSDGTSELRFSHSMLETERPYILRVQALSRLYLSPFSSRMQILLLLPLLLPLHFCDCSILFPLSYSSSAAIRRNLYLDPATFIQRR